MSLRERNEDLVRRFFDTHNRGAEAVLASYDDFLDPDYEWVPVVVGGPESNSYRGIDGVRRYYRERDEAFRDGRVEIVSLESLTDDVLLIFARSIGRGRVSGVALDVEVGLVYRLREGKMLRAQAYSSHSEARVAALTEAAVRA